MPVIKYCNLDFTFWWRHCRNGIFMQRYGHLWTVWNVLWVDERHHSPRKNSLQKTKKFIVIVIIIWAICMSVHSWKSLRVQGARQTKKVIWPLDQCSVTVWLCECERTALSDPEESRETEGSTLGRTGHFTATVLLSWGATGLGQKTLEAEKWTWRTVSAVLCYFSLFFH